MAVPQGVNGPPGAPAACLGAGDPSGNPGWNQGVVHGLHAVMQWHPGFPMAIPPAMPPAMPAMPLAMPAIPAMPAAVGGLAGLGCNPKSTVMLPPQGVQHVGGQIPPGSTGSGPPMAVAVAPAAAPGVLQAAPVISKTLETSKSQETGPQQWEMKKDWLDDDSEEAGEAGEAAVALPKFSWYGFEGTTLDLGG
eukprot:Skav202918  [mRNA]  locus=scaffold1565:145111:147445:- [translate_table: standard]